MLKVNVNATKNSQNSSSPYKWVQFKIIRMIRTKVFQTSWNDFRMVLRQYTLFSKVNNFRVMMDCVCRDFVKTRSNERGTRNFLIFCFLTQWFSTNINRFTQWVTTKREIFCSLLYRPTLWWVLVIAVVELMSEVNKDTRKSFGCVKHENIEPKFQIHVNFVCKITKCVKKIIFFNRQITLFDANSYSLIRFEQKLLPNKFGHFTIHILLKVPRINLFHFTVKLNFWNKNKPLPITFSYMTRTFRKFSTTVEQKKNFNFTWTFKNKIHIQDFRSRVFHNYMFKNSFWPRRHSVCTMLCGVRMFVLLFQN